MIPRSPSSTLSSSSEASDVYKRQGINAEYGGCTRSTMTDDDIQIGEVEDGNTAKETEVQAKVEETIQQQKVAAQAQEQVHAAAEKDNENLQSTEAAVTGSQETSKETSSTTTQAKANDDSTKCRCVIA
eukprot:TRINITY_DN8918_c0_g1_i3.p1 TRINITY_DN8918_c0_g1~~TRINITY_DN8918_c0_g1_i3.p1  ORF type:complete len:129 (-),score=54.35 TRINITY_DN8918_c0_g1_i3:135-521(-)